MRLHYTTAYGDQDVGTGCWLEDCAGLGYSCEECPEETPAIWECGHYSTDPEGGGSAALCDAHRQEWERANGVDGCACD